MGDKAGQSAPGGDVGDLKNKVLCPFLAHALTLARSMMGMSAPCHALYTDIGDMGTTCTIL